MDLVRRGLRRNAYSLQLISRQMHRQRCPSERRLRGVLQHDLYLLLDESQNFGIFHQSSSPRATRGTENIELWTGKERLRSLERVSRRRADRLPVLPDQVQSNSFRRGEYL